MPDLTKRNLLWGTHWGMLCFLLAKNYNSPERDYTDPIVKAIFGQDLINVEQDYVRYTPPSEIKAISDYLGKIDSPKLRVRFAELREDGAYKSKQLPSDDDEALGDLYESFRELREFYESVAKYPTEGVVAQYN